MTNEEKMMLLEKIDRLEQRLSEKINQLEKRFYTQETKVNILEATAVTINKEHKITIPYIDFGIDDDTKLPIRKSEGDCGFDAYALEDTVIPAHGTAKVPLGIGVIIPEPFGIKAETRSGNFLKGLNVGQAWVDRNYRGQINALMQNITSEDILIKKGDRPCSIDLMLTFDMEFVPAKEYYSEKEYEEIMNTNRGTKAFGSSGN